MEPHNAPPTKNDFELQKPNGTKEIPTANEPPRDNPTPVTLPPKTTAQHAPVEPKMGDTRIVDEQQQVYILGFGWIEDNNEPTVGIAVDGDGDFNKMVGIMD